jgi:hypothetical protein
MASAPTSRAARVPDDARIAGGERARQSEHRSPGRVWAILAPVSTPAAPTFAEFLRFIEGDDLGLVLRSHLALEYCLNLTIKKASPRGVGELDRLPFMAKVDVCSLVMAAPAAFRPMFVAASRVRNRFAHDLHASITQRDADEFQATIPRLYFESEAVDMSRSLASAQTPRHQVALCYFIYRARRGGLEGP